MRCTPADSSDYEEDADDGGQYENANTNADANVSKAGKQRRAAKWIRKALDPCRAKAEKYNFRLLLYLLNMASLEARDLSKKPD